MAHVSIHSFQSLLCGWEQREDKPVVLSEAGGREVVCARLRSRLSPGKNRESEAPEYRVGVGQRAEERTEGKFSKWTCDDFNGAGN